MSDPKITRDIILDLLPAVRAGTASAGSRTLVEGFLAGDPEFAARAATLPFPSAELEMEALRRTRHRVRRGSLALAFALMFSLLPLSFIFDGTHGLRFVFAQQPALIAAMLIAGGFCWMGYFRYRGTWGGV